MPNSLRSLLPLALLATLAATVGCSAVPRAFPVFAGAMVGTGVAAHEVGAREEERERREAEEAAEAARELDEMELRSTQELLESPASSPMKSGELEGALPIGALRASISAVDLTSCREAGAPRGYGHARVTIASDGRISKIVIDGPRAMPSSAVSCVGDALATARVPSYRGGEATLGTTWFVP